MVALDDPPTAARTRARPVRRRPSAVAWVRRGGLTTLVFFLPLLLTFAYFSWWPILRSLVLSLQQTNFIVTEWVGLANFERVLADPLLLTAVWNTTYFTLLAVAIGFPVPILLAVLIAEMRRTRGFASVLAYLPVIIPPVVSVLLWKTFYRPDEAGLFNTILGWFGLGPLPWLNDPDLVIPAIVVQATWASFGTAVIIYLATLMTIRTELYEAAEIDGASILRRFWHVTLPQMRGILLIMLLLQLIGTFQVFTEPYIMTGGGPENRSMTLLLLIYRYAFVSGDYGRATALSLLLALALSLLSAIYLWATRRWSTS
ncbi:sugar ABC transporter permease [Occultella glacieicola]|uniref:Sugar ABC transporter permease n=1 Tax=Occultella glacieicola TaxID=2518684 RepID=A0ABY2E2D6_9MICO|nr:sugar ABC transporter permease [Occultella glacieicola]TDE92774.1 sugar ABC transporter permease [Occultella glacieicola]